MAGKNRLASTETTNQLGQERKRPLRPGEGSKSKLPTAVEVLRELYSETESWVLHPESDLLKEIAFRMKYRHGMSINYTTLERWRFGECPMSAIGAHEEFNELLDNLRRKKRTKLYDRVTDGENGWQGSARMLEAKDQSFGNVSKVSVDLSGSLTVDSGKIDGLVSSIQDEIEKEKQG